MFSFNSNRCVWRRGVFALLAMFCLSATLLFTGCPTDPDDPPSPPPPAWQAIVGRWESLSAYSVDGYVVSGTTIYYYSDYVHIVSPENPIDYMAYSGRISYYEAFDATSGVFIIKITDGDWYTDDSIVGQYLGIYYKNGTSTSADITTAMLTDGSYAAEAYPDLVSAKDAFTADHPELALSNWQWAACDKK